MTARVGYGRSVAGGIVVAALIAVGCSNDNTSPLPPAGPAFSKPVTIAAGATIGNATWAAGDSTAGGQGQSVDGVACDTTTPVRHVHAHLSLITNGMQRAIPLGVGVKNPFVIQNFVIAAGCYYWLHTHDATGIVHIEAPVTTTFNLGQFFDIWGQSLSRTNVAGFSGDVTAYVDSTLYDGDLSAIDFTAHKQITLIVGTVPDTIPVYAFPPAY